VIVCSMYEEDIPATWEALADLVQVRATADRLPTPGAPFVMRERERPVSRPEGRVARRKARPPQGRPDQGRTGGRLAD
jgi:hypothetical protein